jgi:radical SAM superfamily enzyme YgiQ (UPF0313 family)
MKVTLVQPPNGLHDTFDLAPPLGLLTVAGAIEEQGFEVAVLDLNLEMISDHSWNRADFYDRAVGAIAATGPDVVGFTSMAVESHVCLELARRLKGEDPAVVTVFGGPHFSAMARTALELYPWVDYVITGEGESAMCQLLRRLAGLPPRGDLVNVARRGDGGVDLDRRLKPLDTMAGLPRPAYHLVDLPRNFAKNPLRLLDYEHGRGCIFNCSFCYSPVHWGQGEQVKEVERIVREVAELYALGARHLFFVQDNFPNSKATARSICQALAAARTGMTWNCYATLPHLLPEFLDDLAAAGCRAVFIGVDAVSNTAQKAFGKPFFRGWEKLSERLRGCLDRGMVPTCAFMVDTPGEDHHLTDVTLTTALFARNLGCGIRLNTLTLYNETPSALAAGMQGRTYTNLKPRLLLDTAEPLHDNPFARERPELFPFHNTYLPLPLYRRFVSGMHVAYTLFTSFPRTLLQYVLVDGGSLWGLLDRVADRLGDLTRLPPVMRRPTEREQFLHDFPRLPLSVATRGALELETAELRLGCNQPEPAVAIRSADEVRRYRAAHFKVIDLPGAPREFDRIMPLPAAESPAQPYLLLRQDKRIRYFELDSPLAATLQNINASGNGEVEVPPAMLGELLQAGVLLPMEPAAERSPS